MKRSNPRNIENIVKKLALDIGPRPIGKPEKLGQTRKFITASFEDIGMKVSLQPVIYKGLEYHNVIAGPHEDPLARRRQDILVVGAHYDTVSTTPGADDNASGIAALLEIARILARFSLKNVVYAAFCMEEPPVFRTKKMGSYRYAKYLSQIGQGLKGMICLEMVGYFTDRPGSQKYPFPLMNRIYPDKGNFIAMVGNLKSRNFTFEFKELFQKHTTVPVESLNAPAIMIGIDFSDHWAFQKLGYQALMVTDTAFYRNPNYHRPSDTPATLDYKKAALVVDGLAGAILDICNRSSPCAI